VPEHPPQDPDDTDAGYRETLEERAYATAEPDTADPADGADAGEDEDDGEPAG
jgi:hypothetical protein